jgi:hypothetical protein
MWFVAERAGKAVAWAVIEDARGGKRQPGELTADSIDELRTMLPAGLTRSKRTAVLPAEVLEVWD